jgi:phosphonate ABC transporter permease subunit PhnE
VGIALAVIAVVVIYAFGFSVTDVDFETTRSETRLTQLTRILRALAHPNLLEYEQAEVDVEAPIYLPCPSAGIAAHAPDTSGAYIVLTPACAGPKEIIRVEGFNFTPGTRGPINFIPPSTAKLTIGNFTADANGEFSVRAELPNRQPVDEAQTIRATARQNIGRPFFSESAKSTFDKIVETVFLALLATTFGTFLAVPLSFVAAKNLMDQVRSPLTSVSLSVLGWPTGIWLGLRATSMLGPLGDSIASNTIFNVGAVVLSPLAIWLLARWAIAPDGSAQPGIALRLVRGLAMLLAGALGILLMYLVADLALTVGEALVDPLGTLGFLGNFIFQLGDSLRMITPIVAAFVAGGALGSLAGRLGQNAADRMDKGLVRSLNLVVAGLAGAMLFALIGAGVDWFYQIDDLTRTLWIPAGVGALIGIAMAIRFDPKTPFAIGSTVYIVTRTILNGTRSVEPLIMVIVFVVWVGIGPFAGALALGLHTVAALSKLFSEQVESILPGPLEAVQATGANRLQTIVYAVIPQIIPPYISFLMYRWDINVRMSTIIGFAGGGGIGFLLQQNIRLLNYRAASMQMLAIAIVVATMDYISSALRQRFV